jgi:hypothetical protein
MSGDIPEGVLLHAIDFPLPCLHPLEFGCLVFVYYGPFLPLGRVVDGCVGFVPRFLGIIPHH